MCGISGIIHRDGSPVLQNDLERMNAVIAHRGPDGDGFFLENELGLAHRRLAILGLGEEGKQPMFLDDRYVITYNGEIYNYIEVGRKLEELGYSFSYQTDTEVILKAWDCWGVDCLQQFNGMWSFALYDRQTRELWCCRDRYGVKPFYYTVSENRFLFGSEIKQLLEITRQAVLNQPVLLDYLLAGLEDHRPETFFKGILKLPAGNYLRYSFDKQEFAVEPWYVLKSETGGQTENPADSSEFLRRLKDAVRLRLRSDVKVGTCLSGGLDSSAIAALAAKSVKQENGSAFSAIHARSVDKAGDESAFAHAVAEFAGLDLQITEPSYKDLLAECLEVIRVQEEPFGSPSVLMQYNVMREARKHGIVVLLDGQGGDETLLGYERYFVPYLSSLSMSERVSAFRMLASNSGLGLSSLLAYFLYFRFPAIRRKRIRKRFHFIQDEYHNQLDTNMLKKLSTDKIPDLQLQEITRFQLPHLLKYEDKNSMAWSVEARLPFLDYRLLEYALTLDPSWKIREGWSKFIVRDALKGQLPDSILWRKNKFGFEAPPGWVNAQSEAFHKEISRSAIIHKLTGGKALVIRDPVVLWRLFNIAAWERMYHVKWE